MQESTSPKPFVFVLMPFDNVFNDIYRFGIKEATDDAGGYCERVDEQVYEERILDRIYNQINKADVIVADLTGRNSNVFYETGYAHALEKRVILLTQTADDIPFDLKHHFHIVYNGNIGYLKDVLTKRLKWYFDNPLRKGLPNSQQLEFYIENQKIEENARISMRGITTASIMQNASLRTDLYIRNSSGILFNEYVKIGFLIPKNSFMVSSDFYKAVLPNDNDRLMYISQSHLEEIFPEDSITRIVAIQSHQNLAEIPMTLRVFTELGNNEINFVVILTAQ